jgi:hypothetical protein
MENILRNVVVRYLSTHKSTLIVLFQYKAVFMCIVNITKNKQAVTKQESYIKMAVFWVTDVS